jgi:hypothetical protein
MAEKKFERRTSLDPAVADLLSGMEQRQAESQLPRKGRGRLGRERAKIQSRRERGAPSALPPPLREEIRVMWEDLRIPASQLVTLALARFLNEYNSGSIDLGKYKQPSRSPRYDWNLVFPDELIRMKKKKG